MVLFSTLGSTFAAPGHPSPLPTTLRPTAWWRGVTVSSRTPSGPAPRCQLAFSPPMDALGPAGRPKEDSSISSAELLYSAPMVLPGQLPGVPEPQPAVFNESTRAAPSYFGTSPPGVPVPPRSTGGPSLAPGVFFRPCLLWQCQAAAHASLQRANCVVSRSPKFCILDLGERHESVSVNSLKPHAGHQSSLRPLPLAVAALLSRWLLQRRHLGAGEVYTHDKSPKYVINPPKGIV